MINDIDSNGNIADAADNEAKIINLDEVRRKRTSPNPVVAMPPQQSKVHARTLPDFAAIAREPDYATRRRQLGEAITAGTGITPSNLHLDSQMISSGFAAGHGCDDSPYPLGSSTDDPAVSIGLALHFSRGNRTVPIPPFIMRQLDHHVANGSAAARLVRDWLNTHTVCFSNPHFGIHEGGRT